MRTCHQLSLFSCFFLYCCLRTAFWNLPLGIFFQHLHCCCQDMMYTSSIYLCLCTLLTLPHWVKWTVPADKKVTPKRKRPLGFDASSPDPGNSSSPRGGSGNVSRLSVPLSERQQLALLMRMTDESSQGGEHVGPQATFMIARPSSEGLLADGGCKEVGMSHFKCYSIAVYITVRLQNKYKSRRSFDIS